MRQVECCSTPTQSASPMPDCALMPPVNNCPPLWLTLSLCFHLEGICLVCSGCLVCLACVECGHFQGKHVCRYFVQFYGPSWSDNDRDFVTFSIVDRAGWVQCEERGVRSLLSQQTVTDTGVLKPSSFGCWSHSGSSISPPPLRVRPVTCATATKPFAASSPGAVAPSFSHSPLTFCFLTFYFD